MLICLPIVCDYFCTPMAALRVVTDYMAGKAETFLCPFTESADTTPSLKGPLINKV